jgi:hypothetical protein
MHRDNMLKFEIENHSRRGSPSNLLDRLVIARKDRQIDGRIVGRLQVHVPTRLVSGGFFKLLKT